VRNRFLDHLGQLVKELQDGVLADGKTIGGLLAIRALMIARAAQARDPDAKMDALIESLIYVTAGSPGRIEHVAGGLCARMARHGHGDAIREAAERLKAEGDAPIERALDGDLLTFYSSLYPAAAYELAVVYIGQAAGRSKHRPRRAEALEEARRERGGAGGAGRRRTGVRDHEPGWKLDRETPAVVAPNTR